MITLDLTPIDRHCLLWSSMVLYIYHLTKPRGSFHAPTKSFLLGLSILACFLFIVPIKTQAQVRDILRYKIIRHALKKKTISSISKWIDTLPEHPEIADRYGQNNFKYQVDSSYFPKLRLRSQDVLSIYFATTGDTITKMGVEIRQTKRFFQTLMDQCSFIQGYSSKTRKIPVELHYNYFQILTESRWRINKPSKYLPEPTFLIKHYRPATGFIQTTKYPYFTLLLEFNIQ